MSTEGKADDVANQISAQIALVVAGQPLIPAISALTTNLACLIGYAAPDKETAGKIAGQNAMYMCGLIDANWSRIKAAQAEDTGAVGNA